MHSPEFRETVRAQIPEVELRFLPATNRFDVIAPLQGTGHVGIELGVAAGSFSARMVASGKFARFYGVDIYGDGHGVQEYKRALLSVGLEADYRLLRMTFEQALDLFPDQSFDFIYCDGYAHTGEEGGRTMVQWYRKLKAGGIMAGDDYDPETWPLVVWGAHNLANQLEQPLYVTDETSDEAYNRYRSWYVIRPENGPDRVHNSLALEILGDAERERVAEHRRKRRQQALAGKRR